MTNKTLNSYRGRHKDYPAPDYVDQMKKSPLHQYDIFLDLPTTCSMMLEMEVGAILKSTRHL